MTRLVLVTLVLLGAGCSSEPKKEGKIVVCSCDSDMEGCSCKHCRNREGGAACPCK